LHHIGLLHDGALESGTHWHPSVVLFVELRFGRNLHLNHAVYKVLTLAAFVCVQNAVHLTNKLNHPVLTVLGRLLWHILVKPETLLLKHL
jgi:hypothetical protein